jgi:hypothetical protein
VHGRCPPVVHGVWAGNIVLATICSARPAEPNEVHVGPKRRMQERLTGFPGIPTSIEGSFSADDKVVTLLVWRGTHTGSYRAFAPTGKPGEV